MARKDATTFEEAKLCPKCEIPGEDVSTVPVPGRPGTTVHTIFCRNEACTWNNTNWIVQVNPDGSIPPPKTKQDKKYGDLPTPTGGEEEYLARLQRQADMEKIPGAEVINPFQ